MKPSPAAAPIGDFMDMGSPVAVCGGVTGASQGVDGGTVNRFSCNNRVLFGFIHISFANIRR